jgi:hypothetical protein
MKKLSKTEELAREMCKVWYYGGTWYFADKLMRGQFLRLARWVLRRGGKLVKGFDEWCKTLPPEFTRK